MISGSRTSKRIQQFHNQLHLVSETSTSRHQIHGADCRLTVEPSNVYQQLSGAHDFSSLKILQSELRSQLIREPVQIFLRSKMELGLKDGSKDSSTHLVVIIDISPDSQILRKEVAIRKDATNKSEVGNGRKLNFEVINEQSLSMISYHANSFTKLTYRTHQTHQPNSPQPYQDWISSIIAFCNAHLMLDHRNQLTVIISGLDNK